MARRRQMSTLTAICWLSLETSYFPSKSHVLHSYREVQNVQDASVKSGPMMDLGSRCPVLLYCIDPRRIHLEPYLCSLRPMTLRFCRFTGVLSGGVRFIIQGQHYRTIGTCNRDVSWLCSEIIEMERNLPSPQTLGMKIKLIYKQGILVGGRCGWVGGTRTSNDY